MQLSNRLERGREREREGEGERVSAWLPLFSINHPTPCTCKNTEDSLLMKIRSATITLVILIGMRERKGDRIS